MREWNAVHTMHIDHDSGKVAGITRAEPAEGDLPQCKGSKSFQAVWKERKGPLIEHLAGELEKNHDLL